MNIAWIAVPAVIFLATSASSQTAAQGQARALFRHADVDGNGRLSRIEFDAAREAVFARVDRDGDDRLTLAEARAVRPAGRPRPGRLLDRSLLQEIRSVDRNRDRVIDIAEFRALGRERFRTTDLDRDGFLALHEIDVRPRAFDWGG